MNNAFCLAMTMVGLLFISCHEQRWEADLDQIEYHPGFIRLDRMVFSPESSAELQKFNADSPEILNTYLQSIMQVTPFDNPMTETLLYGFSHDPTWVEMNGIIENVHGDLHEVELKLGNGLKRYAYFFDEIQLPKLVAYNSGFNYGIYPDSLWLGVGLEWYCGADNAVVRRLPPDLFPAYKRQNMEPKYVVPNALVGWISVKMNHKLTGSTLLDLLVFYGKVRYTAEVLLETESLATILNYTDEEMAFCMENEYLMWNSIVSKDHIFTSDIKVINQLTADGPFTPGMPSNSPGGAGMWLAYQMIAEYMDEHRDVDLKGLWALNDSREILKYYKPRK